VPRAGPHQLTIMTCTQDHVHHVCARQAHDSGPCDKQLLSSHTSTYVFTSHLMHAFECIYVVECSSHFIGLAPHAHHTRQTGSACTSHCEETAPHACLWLRMRITRDRLAPHAHHTAWQRLSMHVTGSCISMALHAYHTSLTHTGCARGPSRNGAAHPHSCLLRSEYAPGCQRVPWNLWPS